MMLIIDTIFRYVSLLNIAAENKMAVYKINLLEAQNLHKLLIFISDVQLHSRLCNLPEILSVCLSYTEIQVPKQLHRGSPTYTKAIMHCHCKGSPS
jgi:hypothetical protein